MPNPTITPWAPGATFTVSGSTFIAADIRLSDIANAPISLTVTAPAGATVHVVRDPAGWNTAETELLGAGGWAAGLISLGGAWDVTIAPGGAVTNPATITVADPTGTHPGGTLRLLFRSLAGANAVVEPAGGTLSIDRVIANPSIVNPQVTSGLPVEELDSVTLGATVQATQSVNPAPASPLAALPPIASVWAPEAANPAAVGAFMSAGATASFNAPAAYQALILSFRLSAVYNLDGTGVASLTNPRNEHVLAVTVTTIAHGMVVVLDRSGSMGASFGGGLSRWDAAVRAAHAWLDLFRAFRPGAEHKAGIVTFEHDSCGWTTATNDDVTLRNPASGAAAATMSSLSGFGDAAQLVLGDVQSCTPIGDALVKAFQEMGEGMLAGSGGKKGSVLLLTDGYENSGRVTIAATKGSAVTTFGVERITQPLAFANGLIGDRLFTLAVGSQVDADRLNDLGAGFYQLANKANEILPAFAEMLGDVLDAQPMVPTASVNDPDNPPHSLYFQVLAGEQSVAFLVPWTAAADNLSVGWRTQGSAASFATVNPVAAGVEYFRRQGHGLLVATIATVTGASAATEWRLQHISGGAAQPMTDADALCMIDLVLKAEVAFDKRQYFIGDTIDLSCRISHGGARVTGATIAVDVARPGEGLGTFLATNADQYKRLGHDLPRDIAKAGDQFKGKGLMHAALLHILQMDQLPIVLPPTLKLFDDGSHGDGAADDGDYANGFTDTAKEGTYTFRFRIEGALPDGSRFSRLFVRSTWVGVRPDPSLLGVVWLGLEDLPFGIFGHLMTFKPKTASGELLGPFRADVINMSLFGGSFDGDLIDNLDGSYSRRVMYQGGQKPVVSIDIYGEKMEPTGPFVGGGTGTSGMTCWALWIAAFCCTINGILKFLGLRK